MFYILTVNKHGDISNRARLVFDIEVVAKTIQFKLICRGHAAQLTQTEQLPERNPDEIQLAHNFLLVGIPPLSTSVVKPP